MILNLKEKIFVFSVLLLFLSVQNASSQAPKMLRSSLSISGSSSSIVVNGDKYFYQQSVGQDGLIGINLSSPLALRQGFIQPIISICKSTKDKNLLRVLVYPNPVDDYVTLTFMDVINDNIVVTIYNSWGKVVDNSLYIAAQELHLNLNELSTGLYIVKITCGNKASSVKLIKK